MKAGFNVKAVEIGSDLAEFTRLKYKEFNNLKVVNTSFEDFEIQSGGVDLVYSATAFHWIKSDIAYPKAMDMLKPGGILALWWNTPRISEDNSELKNETDAIYQKYTGEVYSSTEDITYKNRCAVIQNNFRKYGFTDISLDFYYEHRIFSADEYIELLHTYSDHMILEKETRTAFFDELHKAVSKHKTIKIKDTIDLHMGRS